MGSTRDHIINTTCTLLEQQGYHATGLNQIIAESGVPKGSLYYYFPEGKEELAAEAITRIGQEIEEHIRNSLAAIKDPGEAVQSFILTIAQYVRASNYRTGGPITTVALESTATSERLNQACQNAYRQWQATFEAKLIDSGYNCKRATQLAMLIMASIEGAVTLSRTYRSITPFECVAAELRQYIKMLPKE